MRRDTAGCPRLLSLIERLELDPMVSSPNDVKQELDRFAISGEVTTLLARELLRIRDGGPASRAPSWNRFTLYQGERYTLLLERFVPSPLKEYLTTAGADAEVRMATAKGQTKVAVWRLPPDTDMATLDPNIMAHQAVDIVMNAHCPSASFRAGDIVDMQATEPTLLLVLSKRSIAPFSWVVDSRTRKPLFLSSPNPAFMRSKTLVEIISAFNGSEYEVGGAEELLVQLCDHPLHFLRWSACQVLAKLNLARARPLVARMVHDQHASVQRAARAAASRIAEMDMVEV